jgi:5'-3' exoribonuclease 1
MFKPSPLAKYYPEKFEIDLNGRKYDHEGSVLIPFVKIEEIRAETEKLESLLTDKEKELNTCIDEFIIHDVPHKKLVDQHVVPHLTGINFEMILKGIKFNAFNGRRPYYGTSWYIEPDFNSEPEKKIQDYLRLIGKLVLFDWPFNRPGIVESIFDGKDCYTKNKEGEIETKPAEDMQKKMVPLLRTTRGINVSDSKVGVIVKPYVISSINNAIQRSNKQYFFPIELIMQETSKVMKRYYIPEAPKPKINDIVVLKSDGYKGKKAIVKEIGDKTMKVQLVDENLIDVKFITEDKYLYTLPQIAEEVNLPADILQCALTSINVNCPSLRDADVALTCFHGTYILDGYVTKDKEYLFAKEVIPIIREYLNETDIHVVLRSATPNAKGFISLNMKQFGSEKKVEEIQNWVKKQPMIADAFLINSTQKMATRAATTRLCIRLKNSKYSRSPGNVIEVPNESIHYKGKTGNISKIKVGDRVTSIAPNGPVPFGISGTVVGLDVETFEVFVVTDETFTLGSNLRKRLDSPRGYVAKVNDVIHLQ